MNVNQRIKYIRENMSRSQKELFKKTNINISVMNRIESGERAIRDVC
ncbi:TPA: helix-turn-helix domain-containing protein [Clostridioides difficile]